MYLECKVKSRPKTDNIVWMKDVSRKFLKINDLFQPNIFWCSEAEYSGSVVVVHIVLHLSRLSIKQSIPLYQT